MADNLRLRVVLTEAEQAATNPAMRLTDTSPEAPTTPPAPTATRYDQALPETELCTRAEPICTVLPMTTA